MAEQTPLQPIIIKKIKKGGHGHHGGAWKVAYADFVTAMMAFFLLLWLLSVTTQDKRKAIADYFTPTIGIKDSKGIGMNGGRSPSAKKGKSNTDLTAPGIIIGQVQQGPIPQNPEDAKKPNPEAESTSSGKDDSTNKDATENNDNQDSDQFKLTEDEIKQALENDQDLKKLKNNVQVEQSSEGLKINLIDDPKSPMYTTGGATLTDAGKKVLDGIANIVSKTSNQITIVGHTDAEGPSSNSHYTNWELSADRANAARRGLLTTQIAADRIAKVVGLADRELLVKEQPNNPRNRRVTIVLMRGTYAKEAKGGASAGGRPILSVGDAKINQPAAEETVPVEKGPAKPSMFDTLPNAAPDAAAEPAKP